MKYLPICPECNYRNTFDHSFCDKCDYHLAIPTVFQKFRQRVGRAVRELRGFIEFSIKAAALGALIRFIFSGIL
jgi:hypothetical protein